MTNTANNVPLSRSLDVPFNKLILSQSNVRHVNAGVSIEDLSEDIGRRGLLTALNVRPVLDETGAETGKYEIPAGGRRFRALERLVKAKRLKKDAPIPCVIGDSAAGTSQEDDSLAENTHRVALLDHVAKLSCKSSRKVGGAYAGPPAALLQRAGAGRPGISTCTLFAAVFSGNPAAACTSVQSI